MQSRAPELVTNLQISPGLTFVYAYLFAVFAFFFIPLHGAYPFLGEVVVSGFAWSRALSDACALATVFS